LEAQRKAVTDYLDGGKWQLVAEFVETESGANGDRPKLADAMRTARAHSARLVIAKLDRLSRDAAFLLNLQKSGVKFVAADMPEANELVVGIMAVVAQAERKMISKRTEDALAAAKARGVKLGGFRGRAATAEDRALASRALVAKANARAQDLAPIIARLDPDGSLSLNELARRLNAEACRRRGAALAGLPLASPASRLGWLADPMQGRGDQFPGVDDRDKGDREPLGPKSRQTGSVTVSVGLYAYP
jgi:DNA invertase Pin-like site-specific DNA recombinase